MSTTNAKSKPARKAAPKASKKAPARKAAVKPAQSIRTEKLAATLVEGLSEGNTLRQLCRDNGISKSEVYRWQEDDAEFAGRIARARVRGFDELAEQCLEIANTPEEGTETTVKMTGKEVRTGDMLGHRKLQIETRLKLLAKWDPRRYGDKVQLSGDPDGAPIQTSSTVTLTADEAYKRMLNGG